MQGQYDTHWTLVSALLALALGLLVEQAAVATGDRGLKRAALLLAIYSIVMIWAHIRPAVLIWQACVVRALQSWRTVILHKK